MGVSATRKSAYPGKAHPTQLPNKNPVTSQVTAPFTPNRPPRCCKQLTAQSTVTKATKCNTMQPKTAFSTPSHPVACARRDGFSAAVIMADTGQELGSARAARRRVTLANPPENRASTMVEYLPSICAGADETGKTTSNGSCTRIWTWRRRSAARGPMRRGGHSAT